MAWNPSPKVADCRDIARKWGMQQVIILGINPRTGKYEIASYGETKTLCAEAKAINDRINRIIQEDDYDGPPPAMPPEGVICRTCGGSRKFMDTDVECPDCKPSNIRS